MLLGELRSERNGAVVEAMERGGIRYPLSFGVNLYTIRHLASRFAPDTELSHLLWRQQVRELRLAATMIVDPADIDSESIAEWTSGITTSELAEAVATMTARSTYAAEAVASTFRSTDQPDLVLYAALLVMAHRTELFDSHYVRSVTNRFLNHPNQLLATAAENISISIEG